MSRLHLHRDDHPRTLAIFAALFAGRTPAARGIGFEPTENGAWVDWDRLTSSWLSSTETAVVHLARGIAALEWHGSVPDSLRRPVMDALDAVTCRSPRERLRSHAIAVADAQERRRSPRREADPGPDSGRTP